MENENNAPNKSPPLVCVGVHQHCRRCHGTTSSHPRLPTAHRFTAHMPPAVTNDFPLDAGNNVKDF
jgi:hypothetical protein